MGGIFDPWVEAFESSLVSSRAPVWGASGVCGGCCGEGWSFKSCPRVGGIPWEANRSRREGRFQVVPPCGGHRSYESSLYPLISFQVVPPCGGHLQSIMSKTNYRSFKSCPRVGGIGGRCCFWPVCIVSSRAPVWGASTEPSRVGALGRVSSRAPVWGASRGLLHKPPSYRFQVVPPCGGHQSAQKAKSRALRFQVVPPCGGHQKFPPRTTGAGIVSSRAPVWGASAGITASSSFA